MLGAGSYHACVYLSSIVLGRTWKAERCRKVVRCVHSSPVSVFYELVVAASPLQVCVQRLAQWGFGLQWGLLALLWCTHRGQGSRSLVGTPCHLLLQINLG